MTVLYMQNDKLPYMSTLWIILPGSFAFSFVIQITLPFSYFLLVYILALNRFYRYPCPGCMMNLDHMIPPSLSRCIFSICFLFSARTRINLSNLQEVHFVFTYIIVGPILQHHIFTEPLPSLTRPPGQRQELLRHVKRRCRGVCYLLEVASYLYRLSYLKKLFSMHTQPNTYPIQQFMAWWGYVRPHFCAPPYTRFGYLRFPDASNTTLFYQWDCYTVVSPILRISLGIKQFSRLQHHDKKVLYHRSNNLVIQDNNFYLPQMLQRCMQA